MAAATPSGQPSLTGLPRRTTESHWTTPPRPRLGDAHELRRHVAAPGPGPPDAGRADPWGEGVPGGLPRALPRHAGAQVRRARRPAAGDQGGAAVQHLAARAGAAHGAGRAELVPP